MPPAPDRELAGLRERYQKRAAEVAQVGFMLKGSLVQRCLPCGTPHCHCHADPPQLHGPYWQWSARVQGKTVSRMLTAAQARRYQEWMQNRKRLEQILNEMHEISSQAAAILLTREREPSKSRDASRRGTKSRKSGAQR